MIELRDIRFDYPGRGFQLHIQALDIAAGEHVALIGPSGSGKTTLVSLIAGILRPHHGEVRVAAHGLSRASDAARRRFRLQTIGFVFQEFELVEYLSVRENILLPLTLDKTRRIDRALRERVATLAERMGIGDKLRRYPHALSHGEKQRVAICRALITAPALLIADEPTGNLDPVTARDTVDLLRAEARAHDATLLTVTHDHSLLERFDRTIDMQSLIRIGAV